MTVLVTGSSGYLASLVLPRLAADSAITTLLGLDVRPPRDAPPALRHIPGSVLDADLAPLFAREQVELIVHLAWVFNPTHDREQMRRVDVEGTAAVLAAAARSGVKHVVYLGSTTAYGAHPTNPPRLKETDPTPGSPGFPYSADKAAVEHLLDRFAREHPDVGLTRVRGSIVLGRRTDNFVRTLIDLPLFLRVRGHDPEIQFLHEDDLADFLALVVKQKPRGTYNVAPTDTVRFSEIPRLLGRPSLAVPLPLLRLLVALAWSARLLGVPASYLDFITWSWAADVTRMRDELGFTPRRSSREALLATRHG